MLTPRRRSSVHHFAKMTILIVFLVSVWYLLYLAITEIVSYA